MSAKGNGDQNLTSVERTSDVEIVVTRIINAPARIVYQAWTTPALLMRWWAPRTFGITFISCEVDARTGGAYRLVFGHPSSEQPMVFFGTYIEVVPNVRLVWTNEEGGEDGAITTVTFEEKNGVTTVMMRDRYPTKEALDAAITSGSTHGFSETFAQLEELLSTLDRSTM